MTTSRLKTAVALTLLALAPLAGAQTTIDSFTTAQAIVSDPPGGMTTATTVGSDILGLNRDVLVRLVSGAGPVSAEVASGALSFSVTGTTPDSVGEAVVTWDGAATTLNPTGLGLANLTVGANALRLRVLSATAGTSVVIHVYSNTNDHSRRAVVLPAVVVSTDFYLAFSSFGTSGVMGADFTSVGAIVMTVRGTEVSATIDDFSAVQASSTMTGTLTDNVSVPAIPGQALNYTATIANTGVGDSTNVQLQATLPTSVSLGTIEVSPLARDDSYSVVHDSPLIVAAPGVLANDVDAEPVPDALTATLTSGPTTAQGGSVTLAAAGGFTYTPPTGFLGADSFNYQADDGNGIPGPGTVVIDVVCPTITVTPTSLVDGLFNALYSTVTFTAAGATTAVTWSATGLPPGTALGVSSGDLTGTPTDTGNYTVVVTATDTANCQGSGTIPWTVRPNPDNESYTGGVGNTQFVVNVSGPLTPHVLVNDSVLTGDQGPGTLSAGPAVIATANGGSVAMASNGTFTYSPPVNFAGLSDSFIYTLTDGNLMTNTATVTFALSNRVWYVNNNGGSDSATRGRSHEPLATIGQAVTNASATDTIFVHTGAANYIGASLSKATLTLWGQGTAFSLNDLSIAAGAKPTINSTLSVAAANVTVHSVNIAVTGATQGLAATGQSGLTVNNLGVTSVTGNAVNLSNTSASFANNLSIAVSGSGMGFSATGGGTVSATQDNVTFVNTISTATGTALNVANTTIGASGLTFRSISANGGTNGIVLNTTGSSGGLTVTGAGSAGSGGTIQNKATGISLTSTTSPSVGWMQLNDFSDFGIRGSSVVNFTLSNTVISGTNGNDDGADEGSVRFTELTGSATVTNCAISGAVEHNFQVVNTSGSLNRITVTGSTFGSMNTSTGSDGLLLESLNTAIINATIQNNFFTFAIGDHFQYSNNSTSQSGDVVFTGNTISNTGVTAVSGGGGIRFVGGSNLGGLNGSMTFNVSNNTLRDSRGTALAVNKLGGTGTYSGTIANNVIGVAGVANSGSSEGSDLFVLHDGGGSYTASMTGNTVRQYGNFGIFMQTGGSGVVGSGSMNLTVTGNTASNPGTPVFAKNGIQLNGGVSPGDTYQICLALGGAGALANAITGTGTDGGTDFRLRQRQSTTVRLPGYAGGATDTAAVVAFGQGNNDPVSTPTGSAAVNSPPGSGFVGGAACAVP